jgi:hypothetical protein
MGGSISSEEFDRLLILVERLVRISSDKQTMQANIVIDGQKIADVAEKYMGTTAYGDR